MRANVIHPPVARRLGADKGVLVHLRDKRRKLPLHGHSHPTPFATTDLPLDTLRRGERHCVTMAKRPHLSAKNKTDLLPNKGVLQAASEGGAGFTSRGSRSTVGIASRPAQLETPCVEGGTHPKLWPTFRNTREKLSNCSGLVKSPLGRRTPCQDPYRENYVPVWHGHAYVGFAIGYWLYTSASSDWRRRISMWCCPVI